MWGGRWGTGLEFQEGHWLERPVDRFSMTLAVPELWDHSSRSHPLDGIKGLV